MGAPEAEPAGAPAPLVALPLDAAELPDGNAGSGAGTSAGVTGPVCSRLDAALPLPKATTGVAASSSAASVMMLPPSRRGAGKGLAPCGHAMRDCADCSAARSSSTLVCIVRG